MPVLKLEDGSEVEAYTKEELEQTVNEQVAGLKNKVKELLDETKAERQKRQELESEREEQEQRRQKEKGEFKSLYEKTQTELESLKEESKRYRESIQKRDLESAAAKVANSLTRDPKRFELLKKEVLAFTKFNTDGDVVYEVGGVEITSKKLSEKISEDYPFLVDGPQSSGGGAAQKPNGGAGASSSSSFRNKKLNEMSQSERIEFKKIDPEGFFRALRGG